MIGIKCVEFYTYSEFQDSAMKDTILEDVAIVRYRTIFNREKKDFMYAETVNNFSLDHCVFFIHNGKKLGFDRVHGLTGVRFCDMYMVVDSNQPEFAFNLNWNRMPSLMSGNFPKHLKDFFDTVGMSYVVYVRNNKHTRGGRAHRNRSCTMTFAALALVTLLAAAAPRAL
jgi:hypothetical protein